MNIIAKIVSGFLICASALTAVAQSNYIVNSAPISMGVFSQGSASVIASGVAQASAAGAAVPEHVSVNLFQRQVELNQSKVEFRSEGDYSWFGKVEGIHNSSAILVVKNGVVTGRIDIEGKLFRIGPSVDGGHLLTEIDQSALPGLDHDMAHLGLAEVTDLQRALESETAGEGVEGEAIANAAPFNGVPHVIDILGAYTIEAGNAYADIEARFQLAIDVTNQIYENSLIPHRVNLVGVVPTNHNESGDWDELAWLKDPYDGRLDHINELRDQHDADVVSLWANYIENLCGRASAVFNEGYNAFHIMRVSCGGNVFAHELGHNQGAHHNTEQSTNLDFQYGHGAGSPTNQWRTIMSYGNACTQYCPEIPYFSSPDISYSGEVIGDTVYRDNARVLRETGEEVAGWSAEDVALGAQSVQLKLIDGTTVVDLAQVEPGFWFGRFKLPVAFYDMVIEKDGVDLWQARSSTNYDANYWRQLTENPTSNIRYRVYTVNYDSVVWFDERYQSLRIDVDSKMRPQMYLRGTPNNWDTSIEMLTLISDFYRATVTFEAGGRFKFDVYGDWTENYGVNSATGEFMQGGNDIVVSEAGTYHVFLNMSSYNTGYWLEKVETSTTNVAPVADAGEDFTVSVGESFQFDGSGSTDADGSIVSYEWDAGVSGVDATFTYNIPGNYVVRLTVTDDDGATSIDTVTVTVTEATTWQRTLVFIYGQTQPGQDMFIRGGIDHAYAQSVLGRTCTSQNYECAIPIRHLNLRNNTTAPWKAGDEYLDWYGAEAAQSSASLGSPLDWTTDYWPPAWGTKKTYEIDGSGETPLNTYGQHYWLLEVEMDCTATANGWFELKSFISNGPGWESNVQQPGAPWSSGNHFAECGKLNVFRRGESNPVTIEDL